ncbi:MAG TPA: DMT family transporter [Chloroflexota bacterium]
MAQARVAIRLEAVPAPGLALVALILLNLMWGGSLPATKVALESFGPFTLAAARLVLAGVLFVIAIGPAALLRTTRRDAATMAVLGVLGFAAVQVFQALGAANTSAASATVLASTGPVWIALLAPFVLRERLHLSTLGGVLLALLGVVAITGIDSAAPAGALIVLLSSIAYGVSTLLGKQLAQRHTPLQFCAISCLGGAIATTPLAVWEIAILGPPQPTPLGWALLAYLAILVTFVGFAIWFWGLRALPAARAGALIFLQPLSGLAMAVLLLGDRPTPTFAIGCVLVLVGVTLAAGRS